MKIAVIAHAHFAIKQPYAGGLEAHTDLLVKKLIAHGHDVTLYAKRGTVAPCDVVPIFNGNARGGKNPLLNVAYRVACRKIQFGQYDLVINNSLHPYPLSWHTETMPSMVTIFHTPPLPKMVRELEHGYDQPNRTYIAVSGLTASQWQPHCPATINIVCNGIDMDAWPAHVQATSEQQAIWTGRITPEKGTHVAIEAALKADIPLTIVGSIYDKKYFIKAIKPYIDKGQVEYAGHLDQPAINKLYAESTVALVTPLWDEPFGFVSVEAMASGTPVAALPNGALPSIITPQVGALAADESADALAVAIKQAMTLDRQACASYAAKNYSLDAMVNSYMRLIPDEAPAVPLQWQTYP